MRAFLCLDFVLGFCVRRKIAGSLEPGAWSLEPGARHISSLTVGRVTVNRA